MANVEQKNPERVAAGLKATLHNPTVSEEAKSRAATRLKEMGVDADVPSQETKKTRTATVEEPGEESAETPEDNRVLGGYKATLKNPRVSDEAKKHAKEVLKDHDAI